MRAEAKGEAEGKPRTDDPRGSKSISAFLMCAPKLLLNSSDTLQTLSPSATFPPPSEPLPLSRAEPSITCSGPSPTHRHAKLSLAFKQR